MTAVSTETGLVKGVAPMVAQIGGAHVHACPKSKRFAAASQSNFDPLRILEEQICERKKGYLGFSGLVVDSPDGRADLSVGQ